MQNGVYSNARVEKMKLSDYLETISKEPIGNERLYFSEESVYRILPEITKDYCPPLYIKSKNIRAVIYMGNNVHSQIHFHMRGKALLCQVIGRKRVKLFSPEQTPFLYQELNFSRIEGEPVDLNKYPLYAKARYYECDLDPGEMLFIPIYWWHGVETIGFGCSIVFFWNDPWKSRLFPPRGIPLHYGSMFELYSLALRCKSILRNMISRSNKNAFDKF